MFWLVGLMLMDMTSPQMVGEFSDLGTGFNIPEHTGHVSGRGEDATIVDEAAAGEIAGVTGELARGRGWGPSREDRL